MPGLTKSQPLLKPTINFFVKSFRDSLVALVPTFERVSIPWKDSEQFDEFESIAENLYYWIVLNKLENLIYEKFNKKSNTAKYNYHYKDYSKHSFIEVYTNTDDPLGFQVFRSFGTKDSPFDSVYCDRIDMNGTVLLRDIEFRIDEIKFRFRYRKSNGDLVTFDRLTSD